WINAEVLFAIVAVFNHNLLIALLQYDVRSAKARRWADCIASLRRYFMIRIAAETNMIQFRAMINHEEVHWAKQLQNFLLCRTGTKHTMEEVFAVRYGWRVQDFFQQLNQGNNAAGATGAVEQGKKDDTTGTKALAGMKIDQQQLATVGAGGAAAPTSTTTAKMLNMNYFSYDEVLAQGLKTLLAKLMTGLKLLGDNPLQNSFLNREAVIASM
ncbi:unnamed protein product, partial [Amoebophrya sp. A120]